MSGCHRRGEEFVSQGSAFGYNGSVHVEVREGRLCGGFGGPEQVFPGGGLLVSPCGLVPVKEAGLAVVGDELTP